LQSRLIPYAPLCRGERGQGGRQPQERRLEHDKDDDGMHVRPGRSSAGRGGYTAPGRLGRWGTDRRAGLLSDVRSVLLPLLSLPPGLRGSGTGRRGVAARGGAVVSGGTKRKHDMAGTAAADDSALLAGSDGGAGRGRSLSTA